MIKKIMNRFKITIEPLTFIFWCFVVMVITVLGLLFRRKKAGKNKRNEKV
jgi:hypothetical protein